MTLPQLEQKEIYGWLLKWWPTLAASLVLLAAVSDAIVSSVNYNDGLFVYALDDAYIHMSIARNFVERGVWGLTPYAFSSTTSSPLWTLMIALSYVPAGVNEITPLMMNILLGVGAIAAADRLMYHQQVPALYRFIALVGVIILTPMVTLILTGMEHVLQIVVCLLFIDAAARLLEQDTVPLRTWAGIRIWILGALVSTARYEGLFLVLAFCILFALRRRLVYGVILAAVSFAPIAVYGLIAMANDWSFLPASLMTKSDAGYLSNASPQALVTYFVSDTFNIFKAQHVLLLPVLAAMAAYVFRFFQRRSPWDATLTMLVTFVLTAFATVRLASWPWQGTFARYEAYLIVLALVLLPAALGPYLPRRLNRAALGTYAIGGLLLAFTLGDVYARYIHIAYEKPVITATAEIYHQQLQMADFLRTYYDEAVIAANDVGAINYFTDIDNIDLWGLGTIEVARAMTENRYNPDTIQAIVTARQGQIAMIYTSWFDQFGGVPSAWVEVGSWKILKSPVILGGDTVTFYAINPDAAGALAANLREYAPNLPEDVVFMETEHSDI